MRGAKCNRGAPVQVAVLSFDGGNPVHIPAKLESVTALEKSRACERGTTTCPDKRRQINDIRGSSRADGQPRTIARLHRGRAR